MIRRFWSLRVRFEAARDAGCALHPFSYPGLIVMAYSPYIPAHTWRVQCVQKSARTAHARLRLRFSEAAD